MATRQARLSAFPSEPERPEGQVFEILCEDHVGTYALPFLCRWRDGDWWSAESGERIDAKVIGWRRPSGS
jgi:hypothetical protein